MHSYDHISTISNFVILLVLVGRSVSVFTVVLAFILIPIFTNIWIRVCLRVCVFSNTVPLVCGIDASSDICINSNMDNNTMINANICTHIFVLSLVLILSSVTLSVLD